jgi:hypothetical protein
LPLLIAYPLMLSLRLHRAGARDDVPGGGEVAGDTHIA